MIEATPALETLLAHSNIDLVLPMSMVVPPFSAQYLRFGPEATKLLPQPMPANPDVVFDGVYCFLSTPPKNTAGNDRGGWLELIFIGKGRDRFDGHVSLSGWIDSRYATFNEWVRECMANSGVEPSHGPDDMRSFVSYVVKVFLYLTLKDARRIRILNLVICSIVFRAWGRKIGVSWCKGWRRSTTVSWLDQPLCHPHQATPRRLTR